VAVAPPTTTLPPSHAAEASGNRSATNRRAVSTTSFTGPVCRAPGQESSIRVPEPVSGREPTKLPAGRMFLTPTGR
jgi:hypothetical protein